MRGASSRLAKCVFVGATIYALGVFVLAEQMRPRIKPSGCQRVVLVDLSNCIQTFRQKI